MRRVTLYSLLLVAGLVVSQFLGARGRAPINALTMFCLSFIMVRVGYDFELTKQHTSTYAWDHFVAMTTTVFPWLFCTVYFVFGMAPRELWHSTKMWWEAILAGRFAATTSVGLLFSMLVAAGLTTTWFCRKTRTLAIFDDLDTLILLVPLKILLVSMNLRLMILVGAMLAPSWLAWKYLYVAKRTVNLPGTWPWVMLYAAIIAVASIAFNLRGRAIDENVPVHLEVFLPAFILGCLVARSPRSRPPNYINSDLEQTAANRREQYVSTIVAACFMALVGLSMPTFAALRHNTGDAAYPLSKFEGVSPEALARLQEVPSWSVIAVHVLIVTALSNIGKMFPAFCYRNEASRRERLALAIGMCPRGEVGAGVLVVSLSYGIPPTILLVAVLSLGLNLLCSGLFVFAVKRLVAPVVQSASP